MEAIMKKKFWILTLTTLTIVTLSSSAFAWGPCQGRNFQGRYQGGFTPPADQLASLSQEQQDQMLKLHQAFIDESAAARAAKHAKVEEMKILLETSVPDREKLVQLANEIGDLKKQILERQIDFALKAKAIAPELDAAAIFVGFQRFNNSRFMGMKSCQGRFIKGCNRPDAAGRCCSGTL